MINLTQNNEMGVIASFTDVMRQVKDGKQEHYVEVMKFTVERPVIQPTEAPMEVTGKFFFV